MVEIDINDLKSHINYDPDSGLVMRVRCASGKNKKGGVCKTGFWTEGYKVGIGYRAMSFRGRLIFVHRIAWAIYYGSWPSGSIDHINKNPSDNRIVNLRIVNHSVNGLNRNLSSNNKSGANGVFFHKHSGVYVSYITVLGRSLFLGRFKKIEDAISARRDAEIRFSILEQE